MSSDLPYVEILPMATSAHDPICTNDPCQCDLIGKVREDERRNSKDIAGLIDLLFAGDWNALRSIVKEDK